MRYRGEIRLPEGPCFKRIDVADCRYREPFNAPVRYDTFARRGAISSRIDAYNAHTDIFITASEPASRLICGRLCLRSLTDTLPKIRFCARYITAPLRFKCSLY